jgi:hypothetical protein
MFERYPEITEQTEKDGTNGKHESFPFVPSFSVCSVISPPSDRGANTFAKPLAQLEKFALVYQSALLPGAARIRIFAHPSSSKCFKFASRLKWGVD